MKKILIIFLLFGLSLLMFSCDNETSTDVSPDSSAETSAFIEETSEISDTSAVPYPISYSDAKIYSGDSFVNPIKCPVGGHYIEDGEEIFFDGSGFIAAFESFGGKENIPVLDYKGALRAEYEKELLKFYEVFENGHSGEEYNFGDELPFESGVRYFSVITSVEDENGVISYDNVFAVNFG